MKELKNELNKIDQIYGKVKYGVKQEEKFATQFRRKNVLLKSTFIVVNCAATRIEVSILLAEKV